MSASGRVDIIFGREAAETGLEMLFGVVNGNLNLIRVWPVSAT